MLHFLAARASLRLGCCICGDLHQFPPVAQRTSEYLYQPIHLATDTLECQVGRRIYEEFRTVVSLKEQMRVSDPVWRDLLVHLRYGKVCEHHIRMLKGQIMGRTNADNVDY